MDNDKAKEIIEKVSKKYEEEWIKQKIYSKFLIDFIFHIVIKGWREMEQYYQRYRRNTEIRK